MPPAPGEAEEQVPRKLKVPLLQGGCIRADGYKWRFMGSPWKFNSLPPENRPKRPKRKPDHLPSIIFRYVELRGWFRPYKWSNINGSGFTGPISYNPEISKGYFGPLQEKTGLPGPTL